MGPKGEPFLGVVPGLDHGNDQGSSVLGLLKEPDFQGSPDRTGIVDLGKEHSIFINTIHTC